MTDIPYILQGEPEKFRPLVLENSRRGPVLVCYCDPDTGPCRLLAPRLVRLAREYGGRFLLVFFDTRRHGPWARRQGIISIPHLMLYRDEQVVDELRSAEQEPGLRRFLERHLPRPPAPGHVQALRARQAGDTDTAIRALARAALEHPDDLKILRDLVKLLMLAGRHREAWELLERLPPEARTRPEVAELHVHLDLIVTAQASDDEQKLQQRIAADPGDLASRYALAARQVVGDRPDLALVQLAAVLERDPGYRGGLARRALPVLRAQLGPDHPLLADWAQRFPDTPAD